MPSGDHVLVGDFNLDHLSYFMASLGDGQRLLPMVIDSKGHIIAHPDITLGRQQLNTLEVTESALMGQFEGALPKMRGLEALGVQIAVDDFGTGYSSLAYLRSYPIDELKIDRSFVDDILTDANDAAIVDTVLAMGSRLSLTCVAEGVETRAQFDSLLAMGCREFQGYLFSPPLPAQEFAALWSRLHGHDGRRPSVPGIRHREQG